MNYMYVDLINQIKATVKPTTEELAKEVLDGKWGNGAERKYKLEAAGYSYYDVQAMVNKLLTASKK